MKYQWFTFLSSNLQKVINWFSSLVVSTFIFRDYKFVPLEIKLMKSNDDWFNNKLAE